MSATTPPAGMVRVHTPSAERRRWDGAWPLKGAEIAQLVGAYLCVVGLWALVGRWYTDWSAPNAITRFDERVAETLADNRTGFLNDAATVCAALTDTYNKIAISLLIFGWFLWKWRRWYEAVYMGLPLVFEASAFITITHLVARDRPEVEQLLTSHITSSFPSGHVAAATVYSAVAIVVIKHTSKTWVKALAVSLAVLATVLVAWARAYQGVHFLTDVIAGVLLGVTSVVVTDRILARHEPADLRQRRDDRSEALAEPGPLQ
jgi:membrane-associated phospholipid phosphatase